MNHPNIWNRTVILLSLCVFILICSCEKELKIKAIDRDPKLVVNALFTPYEDFVINISQSLSVTTPGSLKFISNARVDILNPDGSLLKNLPYVNDDIRHGYYSAQGFAPEANKDYLLSVSCDDYPSVSSLSRVPSEVIVAFQDSVSRNYKGSKILDIEIVIKDHREEQNYYIVEVVRNEPVSQDEEVILFPYPLMLFSKDPLVENYLLDSGEFFERLYLTDAQMKTNAYNLNFYVDYTSGNLGGNMEIYVKSVSKDYYNYFFSYDQYKLFEFDPNFSSPIQVSNNINDGLGIFGGYNQKTIILDLEKK